MKGDCNCMKKAGKKEMPFAKGDASKKKASKKTSKKGGKK